VGVSAGGAAPARIRLLYVVANFVTGGAERHLLEMWRRLDRSRFEVRAAVLKREGAFTPLFEATGVPITDLGVGRRIYDPSGARGLLRLISLVQDFRPDVIHGYLFGPNLFAALAGRACGVPVVCVAKRNVDAFESRRQIAIQRLAHRLATHVTAVSREVGESSIALGIPRERVTVIENGVDVGRFDPRAPLAAVPGLPAPPAGAPLVGSVGCLAPRKDFGTLLEALARLAGAGIEFRCAIAGDGPERAALEARAATLGLAEHVTFLGERSDVDRLLPHFDLFVLSSREEGIPNALLEAMAAGRACIATRVGGNAEVLADGRTGWLVPAQDPGALAAALERAIRDPSDAASRGAAAREAMLAERSIDAMVRRHEAFYERALASVRGEGGSRPRAERDARSEARRVEAEPAA
jgi:glycosyltransferase involved in cell wall biosynthesis